MILEFTAYVVNFSWRRYLRTSVQSAFSPSLRWWPSTAWAATASPSRPSGWRSRCAESTSRSSLTTTSRPACLSSCRGWDYAAPIGGIVNHPTIIQWDWKGVEKEEKLYSKTCIKAQRLSHSTSATSRFCPKSNIMSRPKLSFLKSTDQNQPTVQVLNNNCARFRWVSWCRPPSSPGEWRFWSLSFSCSSTSRRAPPRTRPSLTRSTRSRKVPSLLWRHFHVRGLDFYFWKKLHCSLVKCKSQSQQLTKPNLAHGNGTTTV